MAVKVIHDGTAHFAHATTPLRAQPATFRPRYGALLRSNRARCAPPPIVATLVESIAIVQWNEVGRAPRPAPLCATLGYTR